MELEELLKAIQDEAVRATENRNKIGVNHLDRQDLNISQIAALKELEEPKPDFFESLAK